jgi:predicted Holliday junction resolvase-like endonuclease
MLFNVIILGSLVCVLACGIYIYKLIHKQKVQLRNALDLAKENGTKAIELSELVDIQKNVILSQRSEINSQNIGIERLKEKNEVVTSQKKSSEVRLGIIGENFMPLISSFPYDHKRFRFLANPCDGIFFGDNEVVFLEFKTGNAKLSDSQKKIKDLVGRGKVRFETFRVNEKGTHLKIESSMENIT